MYIVIYFTAYKRSHEIFDGGSVIFIEIEIDYPFRKKMLEFIWFRNEAESHL